MNPTRKILFMCVANSARSQMAEALARKVWGESVWVESAGSAPTKVNPLAIRVLEESGCETVHARSKAASELPAEFLRGLNFVITLCAEEVCPLFLQDRAERIHWPLPDPAAVSGSEPERLAAFRGIRDQIRERIEHFRVDR